MYATVDTSLQPPINRINVGKFKVTMIQCRSTEILCVISFLTVYRNFNSSDVRVIRARMLAWKGQGLATNCRIYFSYFYEEWKSRKRWICGIKPGSLSWLRICVGAVHEFYTLRQYAQTKITSCNDTRNTTLNHAYTNILTQNKL